MSNELSSSPVSRVPYQLIGPLSHVWVFLIHDSREEGSGR